MKRNTILLALIAVAICLLTRNSNGLQEDAAVRIVEETPPQAIESQQIPEPSDLPQDSLNADILIPDPTETEETATVRIPKRGGYADLGFLGFPQKVQIAAFTSDSEATNKGVVCLNGEENEANKVILVIIAPKDETFDLTNDPNPPIKDIQGYLAVLDYKSHTRYVTKMNIFPNRLAVKYVSYFDSGYSNDNCVIVYRDFYKYRDTEVYRYFPEEDEYRVAYINYWYSDDGGYADFDDREFSGYLVDDYKVVVECEMLHFSKTFSLLDRGLTEADLEMKYGIKDDEDEPEDYYITRSLRFYDNGKWMGSDHVPMVVYRAEFDGLQDPNYLKFTYSFNIDKYFTLGNAIVYFRYNPETQHYEPAKASFEIEVF